MPSLGPTLVDFVAAHLQLKNTLKQAKEEMEAAAKAAQAEARAKSKTPVKKDAPASTGTCEAGSACQSADGTGTPPPPQDRESVRRASPTLPPAPTFDRARQSRARRRGRGKILTEVKVHETDDDESHRRGSLSPFPDFYVLLVG